MHGSTFLRAVNNFVVSFSKNNIDYDTVTSGSLFYSLGKTCDQIPIEEFPLDQPRTERFIKFTAIDYHVNGAALQYLGWK